MLIEIGYANIEITNTLGQNVLHLAARLDQAEMCFYLIKILGLNVNRPDADNNTPLHLAVQEVCVLAAIWLSCLGAEVNMTNSEGKIPFHLAFESIQHRFFRHDVIIRQLMIKGADKTIKDAQGDDAFAYAKKCRAKKQDLLKVLKQGDERYANNCADRIELKI